MSLHTPLPPETVSLMLLHSLRRLCFALLALTFLLCSESHATADDAIDFDRQIAPLLVEKCLDCHDSREKKGNLDLSSKATTMQGGDSGIVVTPGKLDESFLWDRVRDDEMPPKHPLSQAEKELFKAWIAQGAKWGRDPIDPYAFTTEKRAGSDWWSLQSLKQPELSADARSVHPVDFFVRRKLVENNLTPSPVANKRTLIRRLSLDLIGLPPTSDEVEQYVANDSPDAYAQLVDRLLASPQYGERWARHWLDLARFGESQGFERDKIRENSWRYRDWVIEALNADMPYDQFARMQIAGDVLQPENADAIIATGFLVAAPYDEVGQSQQSLVMRAVVRQDELEDIVGTVGQTFLGLTVNCARCHSHKFDPITQTEYYQLTAALAGVRHGERKIEIEESKDRVKQLQQQWAKLRKQIAQRLASAKTQILAERKTKPAKPAPMPIARWSFDVDFRDEIGGLHLTPIGGARLDKDRLLLDGKQAFVRSKPLPVSLEEKTLEAWVQTDNLDQRGGGVFSIQTRDGNLFDAIVYGEKDPKQWLSGSNSFKRTQSFGGPQETETTQPIHIAIVYSADGTIVCYRNGEQYGRAYQSDGPQVFEADKAEILFGLRHGTSAGGNRNFAGTIDQAQLYDRALTAEEVAISAGRADYVSREAQLAALNDLERKELLDWEQKVVELENQIGQLQNTTTYAVNPKPPEPTHLLLRGNPGTPAELVTPAGIASIQGVPSDWGVSQDGTDKSRRIALAEWITSRDNPLFARVIVNRLWHYHFGVGLVDSPNDFGFNGGRPTHPELLDFLATKLLENEFSLKALHRLIVTSESYRQSSQVREECLAIDADNRLLWRFAPQRLEAEVLRDSILKVAGELNPQVGGPPYRDFDTFIFNSQYYVMTDPVGAEFNRRTIYRMWIRSGRNGFLDAFDCPDPSTTAPDRAVTTTPSQSLSLLNNSFVLRMSENLATHVAKNSQTHEEQVAAMFERVYQRAPTAEERNKVKSFVTQHGLTALGRVLFNSNEFLFVE